MKDKEIEVLKEQIEKTVSDAFDKQFAEKLAPMMGQVATEKAQAIVESMKMERYMTGTDLSLLSKKQKIDFVKVVQATSTSFTLTVTPP